MKEVLAKLTEKTLVPVSLVIVLLGGMAWLTNVYSVASEAAKNADAALKAAQSIDRRLSRIEGKLGIEGN